MQYNMAQPTHEECAPESPLLIYVQDLHINTNIIEQKHFL